MLRLMKALATAAVLWGALPVAGHAQDKPMIDKITIAGGIDPIGVNAVDVFTVFPDRSLMEHIGDTLLRQSKPGVTGPWLATSWQMIDPVTYEFKLRQDVKFQNGEPFTAAAIKTYYDLVQDPKSAAPFRSNHAFVKEVQIVDDYTLRIVTHQPYPAALPQFNSVYAIPPNYIKEVGLDGYRRKPIGTGPYQITERVKDSHMTLTAFSGYWGGPQKIKQIVYRPIPEAAARVGALLTGEVDVAMDIPPELRPMVDKSRNAKIKSVLTGRVYILQMNTLQADYPTRNRALREAINYAIDRESLARDILQGAGAPSPWFNPQTFGVNPDLKPIAYDPDRAKKLLVEAGFPNGVDLDLETPSGRYIKDKEMAEAIAGQLSKIGIRTTAKTVEWGVLMKRFFSHTVAPLSLLAYGDYTGDPEGANRVILRKGGVNAVTDDADLEAIMQKVATEMDPEKRKQLMYAQQDHMRQSFPLAFLVRLAVVVGTGPKLADWQPRSDERYYFFQNKFDQQ